MSNVEVHIRKLIADNGYITIDHFLSLVIPYYYANQNSLGEDGDFVTAPEVSQLFGEMIGVYVANYWLNSSRKKFSLLEFGPGKGYLMLDFLRATAHIQGLYQSIENIVLYEASPKLKEVQENTLQKYTEKCLWLSSLEELVQYCQNRCIYFIANEFFDALPIKQYQYTKGSLYERCLVLNCLGNLEIKPLIALQGNFVTKDEQKYAEGWIIEHAHVSERYMDLIMPSIFKNGGLSLIIDYGHTMSNGINTLQALKRHKSIDILESIGEADITSLVDFSFLLSKFRGLANVSLMSQKEFLELCGIQQRAQMLIKKLRSEERKEKLLASLNILLSSDRMGTLFKVLIASSENH